VQDNAIIGCASCEFCDNRIKRLGKLSIIAKVVGNAIIGCASCEFCDNHKTPRKETRLSQRFVKEDAIIARASWWDFAIIV
jgi:hypothetical protein